MAEPTPLAPKPGFDWSRVNWLGPDQPLIAGDADCEVCSYCGDDIPEDSVPLRLFGRGDREGWGAVFCDHCQTVWFGVQSFEEPVEPQHEPEIRTRRKR